VAVFTALASARGSRGSGDCTAIDWTFLGGSIANWSFICFVGFGVVLLALLARAGRVKNDGRAALA